MSTASTATAQSTVRLAQDTGHPDQPVQNDPYSTRSLVLRYAAFIIGLVINSFGVVFITKGALGTSPISSVPYVLSLQFPALSFGVTTFIVNVVFVVIEIVLLRSDFRPFDLLQLVANLLFSACIDLSTGLLSWLDPQVLPTQLLSVIVGCAILAFGLSVEVAPNVLVVPGEGVVRAIAAVARARFGTVKNLFDITLVAIAVVLSLLFFGGINGLGLGTIISAILVGRLCNVYNAHLPLIDRIRRLAE